MPKESLKVWRGGGKEKRLSRVKRNSGGARRGAQPQQKSRLLNGHDVGTGLAELLFFSYFTMLIIFSSITMHLPAACAFGLGLAAVASAASLPPRRHQIDWTPCVNDTDKGIKFPPRIQCATLSVPLDYTDKKSNARTLVELNRLPAVKTPSSGSILVNFGGPGQSGTKGLIKIGEVMQAYGHVPLRTGVTMCRH